MLETFLSIGQKMLGPPAQVDVLFIDEAGQLSLADAVAASGSARNMPAWRPDGRLVPYEELVLRATLLYGKRYSIRAAAPEDIIRAKERPDRAKDREARPERRALRDASAGGDAPLSQSPVPETLNPHASDDVPDWRAS